MSEEATTKKVSFMFHPKLNDDGSMAIIKSMHGGKKRKYVEGISSGLAEDAHKEKVSEDCIKSFMEQADSQDILLYPDIHGIKQSEDIGILETADILVNGDWFTRYRLYDEDDDIGSAKLDKINTLWKQMEGLPPYKKKKQMGFSIEGIIPKNGVLMSSTGKTILDKILLDGVILVPRPAYITSIANSVYKALGEISPWVTSKTTKSIQGKLSKIIEEKELNNKYWDLKYDLQSALSQSIDEIMCDKQGYKEERLSIIFNEYRDAMVSLLLESQAIFKKDELSNLVAKTVNTAERKKAIYKALSEKLTLLQKR